MTKRAVTRFFVGSLLAVGGGLILAAVATLAALANGSLVYNGPDVVGVNESAFGWAMIIVATVGGLVMIGGAIGQFVAWIGAVLNTARLEDKTWFVALLLLGLFSFGFVAMVVYVIAGPDGTEAITARSVAPARPAPTA